MKHQTYDFTAMVDTLNGWGMSIEDCRQELMLMCAKIAYITQTSDAETAIGVQCDLMWLHDLLGKVVDTSKTRFTTSL